jgi:UDP-glucose:(heptosyl)LPS alpha-1,3-glucosyltransferase
MRIAFGIGTLFPSGGLQRDCLEIARLLRGRGHEVTIFAERVLADVAADGIPVVVLPNGMRSNHRGQEQFGRDFARAAAGHDLKVGFNKLQGLDVLYCADPSMRSRLARQPYLRLLPRYRTYERLEAESFKPGGSTTAILLSRNQVLEFWNAWHTEPRRIFLAPPTLAETRRRPEHRTDGTRQTMRAALGLADADWTWLTSGVQPHTKGMDRVVSALAAFPDAVLLIAGLHETDKAARPVVSLANRLGAAPRIKWLGHREDMPRVMAAADLLLHASRYDTTGTVILEAVVNGLPVVATQVCGYASHVTAAGAGVVVGEPFRPEAFAAAIATARDPAAGKRWSDAGIAYGRRPGLSDGRACAAEIILAAARTKAGETDSAVAAPACDISALQPAEGSDWDAYFEATALSGPRK